MQISCVNTPVITYFDSADSTKLQLLPENIAPSSIIRKNDILAITVGSLSQESNEILNFNNINPLFTTSFPGQNSGQRGQPLGFLVDAEGKVELPMIGRVKVEGLLLSDAADTLRNQVAKLLRDPSINVRFLNHKFSVLGEVNRPAVYNLLDDKTTLPEALALAGDLTPFGNRQNVTVVRDFYGKREMVKINLRSKEIFESPYYYLKDGDMIYVEPVKARATYTDQKVQLAPLYLSALSALTVLMTVVFNVFK
jgi:polysaccharide biosynthesis/export protein